MHGPSTNAPVYRGAAPLKGSRVELHKLEGTLQKAYGAPQSSLGNKRNPLNEAIYIILSYQTNLSRSKLIWGRLRSSFPRWNELETARTSHLMRVLLEGGLQRQKAREIKALLRAVRKLFGKLSLNSLRKEPDEQVERVLTQLPGLSWKGARCVMLYALGRKVFPVDINTVRILKRAGIIRADAVYRRKSFHDALQAAVPESVRNRFHVNLVVHGQRTCLPKNPRCESCAIRTTCPRIGLPKG
jgi:endonuclease III